MTEIQNHQIFALRPTILEPTIEVDLYGLAGFRPYLSVEFIVCTITENQELGNLLPLKNFVKILTKKNF